MRRFARALRRRTSSTALLCVALIALADWLFYRQPAGWTIGAFGGVLLLAVVARNPRVLAGGAGPMAIVATALLLGACVVEPGPLPVTLAALGLVVVAIAARSGWTRDAATWYRRIGRFAAAPFARFPRDLWTCRRRLLRRPGADRSSLARLHLWLLPVGLKLVFLALFYVANPVIARWIDDAALAVRHGAVRFAEITGPLRLLLWAGVGACAWALLRARDRRRPSILRHGPAPAGWSDRHLTASAIARCLVLFNLLFAVHTGLDAVYLWGGAALPEGMTYATYARRGAYALVATALLAGVFVLGAFRRGSAGERSALTRRLVALWVGQNVLLLGSAAWRLHLYVDAYGLTRLRFAAGVWMALVAIGLVTTMVRLGLRRSNDWLLGANTLAALAVLSVIAFVNVDRIIANHNADHCREVGGPGGPIDLDYLEALGPDALPALRRLADELDDVRVAPLAQGAVMRLSGELESRLASWRGWTWRRARLAARDRP